MEWHEYRGYRVELLVDYFDDLDIKREDILCETAKGNGYSILINFVLSVKNTLENTVESAFRVTHLPTKTMIHCDHSDDLIENLHMALGEMKAILLNLKHRAPNPNRAQKRKAAKLDRVHRRKIKYVDVA